MTNTLGLSARETALLCVNIALGVALAWYRAERRGEGQKNPEFIRVGIGLLAAAIVGGDAAVHGASTGTLVALCVLALLAFHGTTRLMEPLFDRMFGLSRRQRIKRFDLSGTHKLVYRVTDQNRRDVPSRIVLAYADEKGVVLVEKRWWGLSTSGVRIPNGLRGTAVPARGVGVGSTAAVAITWRDQNNAVQGPIHLPVIANQLNEVCATINQALK